MRLGLRRGGVVAFAKGRDTISSIETVCAVCGMVSRNGRNVGRNARRMPNEGLAGTFLESLKDN